MLQEKYNFKALNYHAKGFANKEEFRAKYGSDLYLVDIDQYDSICKASHCPHQGNRLKNAPRSLPFPARPLYLNEDDDVHFALQVEPFNRALVETEADVMINGRRQDHGFERAQIEVTNESLR